MTNNPADSIARELLEVRQTLGWMDLVIGSINDAVYVTDEKSRLIFVNQSFSDLLGIPRAFLLGEQLDEVFSVTVNSEPNIEYLSEQSISTDAHNQRTDIFNWEHGGQMYVFRVSSRRLQATNQTVYLAQNITQEHELSHMKNSFIKLASHQLRTPMTAIMMYSHMLHDGYSGDISPAQKQLAGTIVTASERMIKLINEILNITRLQNEKTGFEKHKVSILDIFSKIDTEIQPQTKEKQLVYKKEIPSVIPYILSDSGTIHEIISSLLINAIQYTPEGGRIRVKVAAENKYMSIMIQDNGIGIPKEYLPKIFNQFSRADNALEAYTEGTGLGLYMVKILLDKIGGTIECRSTLSVGTTFTVKIPLS